MIYQKYRENQLTVNLSNYCFQSLLWPAAEFIGGVLLINLLYVFIICHSVFSLPGIFCLCLIIVIVLTIECLMLNMGSKLRLVSMKILRRSKCWNGCKFLRKSFRSCRPIEVCVGDFHKMDRGRGPSFIRFVVQRTFALVFKTKLSVDYGSKFVVYFP